jgi:hypothetical protein
MSNFRSRFDTWRNPSWWHFAVVLPWVLGLIFLVHSGISDLQISKRQQTIQGTITVHEASNHDRYGYVFSVAGKSYTGWESPRRGPLDVGAQVLVHYDPRDPSRNALTDFGDLSSDEFGPVPLLLLGIGGVAYLILRLRASARKKALDATR